MFLLQKTRNIIFCRVSSVNNVTVKTVRTKPVFSYLFDGNPLTVLTVTTLYIETSPMKSMTDLH